MKRFLLVLALWLAAVGRAFAAGPVDPALVGTWKLEWGGAPLYWAVREDGIYRLHGPGAKPRQAGRMMTNPPQWSIKAPGWEDSGTYRLADADTWVVNGRLGAGTWKRVWKPANVSAEQTAGSGLCGLVTADEVARVLRAPVSANAADSRLPGGCVFRSQLGELDQLTLSSRQISSPQTWKANRRRPGPRTADISGVSEEAYAEIDGGGHLVARILKGDREVIIRLTLTPGAIIEDVPQLAELVRAADRRWVAAAPSASDRDWYNR